MNLSSTIFSLRLRRSRSSRSWARGNLVGVAIWGLMATTLCADPPTIVKVWPGRPPGETTELPTEADTSTDESPKVAGRYVIRLGNVSKPTLEIYPARGERISDTAVVICPGGGHHILAYDLEGTEVAEYLAEHGVTGIVLKYRVPARNPDKRWEAAVQDAQRAVSLVRKMADELNVSRDRVGILGFSAGGQTAALTALFESRQYEPIDDVDQFDAQPSFGVLVYPAYLANETRDALVPEVSITEKTPPLLMVHAYDDPVPVENSVLLFLEMKRAGRPAELHAFTTGGHGYGMRRTDEPVTQWPELCRDWMTRNGLVKYTEH